MLRNVCDRCNEIIDGEPQIEKEYPDATLLIDDDVVVMFENLCDKCKDGLRRSVSDFTRHPSPEPKPTKEHPAAQATSTDDEKRPIPETATQAEVDAIKESAKRQPLQKVDPESLPNQVTKQFPIHLPERPNKG